MITATLRTLPYRSLFQKWRCNSFYRIRSNCSSEHRRSDHRRSGIVFLIILFILSEIWRKDKYEEDEEDVEEESEEDSQEDEEEEEEEVLSRRERRRLKKEEKRRRKLAEKESREEEEGEEEETEEELPEIQDHEDADPAEQSMSGEDLDKAVAEAMSSVAAGVSQISEPEQVPDATIVMPDLGKIDQENIPDEIQERPEENSQEENEEISEETESSEVTEEEKPRKRRNLLKKKRSLKKFRSLWKQKRKKRLIIRNLFPTRLQ